MKYRFTKEDLQKAVDTSLSIAQVCRVLGIVPAGGNYKTLNSKFKLWDIDISHFTGKAWNQGERFKPFGKKIPLKVALVENSTYTSTHHLKVRLFKEGIKEKVCEGCGLSEWRNKPIPLELNHINGKNLDHRLENLEILCPNCHAQSDFYRGRNKLGALSKMEDVEYRKFRETLTLEGDGNPEPSPIREGAET